MRNNKFPKIFVWFVLFGFIVFFSFFIRDLVENNKLSQINSLSVDKIILENKNGKVSDLISDNKNRFIHELKSPSIGAHNTSYMRASQIEDYAINITIIFKNRKKLFYQLDRDSKLDYEFWLFTHYDPYNTFKQIRSKWILKYLTENNLYNKK